MASSTDSTDALPEDSAPDNETPQAGSTAEGQVEAASTATPPLPDDGSRPAHNVAGSSPHAYQFNNPGGALAYLEAALAKETDTRPPLVYMTDCPSLPATRPPGFPHIIDLHRDRFHTDETNCADLTCADGIATFLWKWDKEQFHRFFDLLAVPEFEIHYEVPGEVQYRTNDTVISRTNRTVTVRWRVGHGRGSDQEIVFEIQVDESWKPVQSWASENGERVFTAAIYVDGSGQEFAIGLLGGELFLLEEEGMSITVVK